MRTVLASVLLVLFSGSALAQSCNALRSELAAAQSSTGGGGELAALRRQASAYGCDTSSRWGRHRACAGIEARMRNAGGGDSRRIRRLQRKVAKACAPATATREPRRQQASRPQPPASGIIIHGTRPDNELDPDAGAGGFLSRLFGGSEREFEIVEEDAGRPATGTVERVDLNAARSSTRSSQPEEIRVAATRSSGRAKGVLRVGSTRTVCVRLCDGYYFPINSRSHSDNFYDEHAMCIGRCPGADVSLYAHDADAPVESMRSTMTGERYVNLPTAFLYRKEALPGCSCQSRSVIAEGSATPAMSFAPRAVADGTGGASQEGDGTTAAGPAWQRFRAVYDVTGAPLPPSPASSGTPAPAQAADAGAAEAARGSGDGAAVITPAPVLRVREVGPRYYSQAIRTHLEQRRRVRRAGPRYTSTAVTVVPVTADMSVPSPATVATDPADADPGLGLDLSVGPPAAIEPPAPQLATAIP